MCWGAAHVGVWGSWGSSSSLNAASTRSVWEGSSVSQNVFMLKHACICIHRACNHSNRGRASVLFQYLHANPTSVFLSAEGSCTPTCARYRAGKRLTDRPTKQKHVGLRWHLRRAPLPALCQPLPGRCDAGPGSQPRSNSGRGVLESRHQ